MGSDALQDGGHFRLGEPEFIEQRRRLGAGIGDVIPSGKLFNGRRPVSDENSQVMQPGCSEKNVIVIRLALREADSQMIQSCLVAEFVRWLSLCSNVGYQSLVKIMHGQSIR